MRAAILLVVASCAAEPAAYEWDLPPSFPLPTVPADNPMTAEKVALGRLLFYDPRLSRTGTQSCASCHRQERAFTDGAAVSIGATGEHGRRSAMSLVNLAYAETLTWDGRVRSLEAQALVPMYGDTPVELGLDPAEDLAARLGEDPRYAGLEDIPQALAAFQRTIISGASRFDRALAGEVTLTDREQAGRALFEAQCARCHAGFTFARVDDAYFNIGLHESSPASDRGVAEVTGLAAHEGRFRPPTLRNIAVTAPYMHDGSVATLDEVLDIYANGGRGDGAHAPQKDPSLRGFPLSTTDRAALLAFLASLTDESLLANPAYSDPWPANPIPPAT